jgi:4-amino-4-deoxy-L-arabinose transferase-like glycosyltransferase
MESLLSTDNPENPAEPSILPRPAAPDSLRWADYLLLIAFCTVLFGYVAISGRPMTLHEARLPECAREMMAQHNWLIPMNGSRPWLERPPFPHWCMIAVATVIGQHCDTEWSARIAPALAGLLIVLMVGRIAAGLLGRNIGIVSALALATMFEFYNYSTLSEDDIFLALLVVAAIALFVKIEFLTDPAAPAGSLDIFAWRPWRTLAFFILLGLTNLAKGPIVGAAVIVGPLAVYFLIPPIQWPRLRRYIWLWGILIAAAVAISWHAYVAWRYPGPGGYLANLRYDFSGTTEFDEPWWYYPPTLLFVGLPWTPAALVGLFITARAAWRDRNRALQFLWCWAIIPIIVLSLPHRKHHHYLVPSLAPWAILAAIGLKPIAQNMFNGAAWSRRPRFGLLAFGLPGSAAIAVLAWKRLLSPSHEMHAQIQSAAMLIALWIACVLMFYYGTWKKSTRWMLAAFLIGFGGAYSWKQTHLRDDTVADTQFLRQRVEAVVPRDNVLAINAAIGPLDFFRIQFYLRDDAILLHNLSFLRSDQIHAPDAYIVGQTSDLSSLQSLGTVELIATSPRPKKVNVPSLALFHLIYATDLKRYPPPKVSPMQAMMRESGPWCGPELPEPAAN